MAIGSTKVGHYEEMGKLNGINALEGDDKRNVTIEQMNRQCDGTDIDMESRADFNADKNIDS
jgi:hypothetical protein